MDSKSVLFITLDSCRYDTFKKALKSGNLPLLESIGPLHKALAPSHFTYGSHASFWMGFTPGVINCKDKFLNPKKGKLFRMIFGGFSESKNDEYSLIGKNIIDGFNRKHYYTIGSGAVDWFNDSTETGKVLTEDFEDFFFSGNTWSLNKQLSWLLEKLSHVRADTPVFCFLNIGETHVPYWHKDAEWERWPSPCVPFGDEHSNRRECERRQLECLKWVDSQIVGLVNQFQNCTILICADHGDCWGEDGLWEHGISHPATLTVPLLLRVKGISIENSRKRKNISRIFKKIRDSV